MKFFHNQRAPPPLFPLPAAPLSLFFIRFYSTLLEIVLHRCFPFLLDIPFSVGRPDPCAALMNRAQTGAARVDPLPGRDELSSLPTHTTQVREGVYPANQASL